MERWRPRRLACLRLAASAPMSKIAIDNKAAFRPPLG
jgi:hypothetical protein